MTVRLCCQDPDAPLGDASYEAGKDKKVVPAVKKATKKGE